MVGTEVGKFYRKLHSTELILSEPLLLNQMTHMTGSKESHESGVALQPGDLGAQPPGTLGCVFLTPGQAHFPGLPQIAPGGLV